MTVVDTTLKLASVESARKIRVMLVEDHALVRAAVRQAMSARDVEMVAEAATGEDALLLAPRIRPDVMLVDIDLPGIDGVELVRLLVPRLPETRMVMLTASTAERDVMEAMRGGASGFLGKDVTPDALLRAIRGAHQGDLAMPRQMAGRLMRRIMETWHQPPDRSPDPGIASLTAREEEILRVLADGLSDRAIAETLTLSTRTVETHVSSIIHKLDVRNRAEAARRYLDQY